MTEVSKTGHFKIDLPSSDAATALSGPGNSFLKKFESLTGVSLTSYWSFFNYKRLAT